MTETDTLQEPVELDTEADEESREVLKDLPRASLPDDIKVARLELQEREAELAQAAEAYKQARAAVAAAQAKLNSLIDDYISPEPSLFDQPDETKDDSGSNPDWWRDVPIAELGLPQGIVQRLAEAAIETIGQLATHTESGQHLTDIPGIGQAKAEKIEDALQTFWERNTDKLQSSDSVAAEGDEEIPNDPDKLRRFLNEMKLAGIPGMAPGDAERLFRAGFHTVGDLCRFYAAGQEDLENVDGFSVEAEDRIVEIVRRFINDHGGRIGLVESLEQWAIRKGFGPSDNNRQTE